MTYSLIDEPWMPVATESGPIEVSLVEALDRAHEVKGLAAASPTVGVSILRQVLVPFVLDALGPPRTAEEWAERFGRGRFDLSEFEPYLAAVRPRFDLFDPEEPFGQVAGLTALNGEVKSPNALVFAVSSGNSVPVFSVATDGTPAALAPAEAVRLLLHLHCYDTAAIKSGAVGDLKAKAGKTTGNPTGPVGRFGAVVPTGENLFQTLMLNLPIRDTGADPNDSPWWRRPHPTAEWVERSALGVLDLLTWQSRRVRLVTSADPETGEVVVTGVVISAGDRLVAFPDVEPHCMWTIDAKPKAGAPPRRPRRAQGGRSAWRGLDSLLALPGQEGGRPGVETSHLLHQLADVRGRDLVPAKLRLGVEVTGIEYGNMSAVVEDVVHDAIPLPVGALVASELRGFVLRLATDTDALIGLVDRLEADVARSLGGEMAPWDRGQRRSVLLAQRLDRVARRVLALLRDDPDRDDELEAAWAELARSETLGLADEILSDVAPTAYAGRLDDRQVRSTVSDAELRFRAGLRKQLDIDDLNVSPGIEEAS